VTSPGERELFLIIGSRRPLHELEELLEELPPARFDQVQYPDVDAQKLDRIRGIMGLAVADSNQAPVDAELLHRIDALAGTPENARNVWVRRVELANPAHP
jgi:hypothetical protein